MSRLADDCYVEGLGGGLAVGVGAGDCHSRRTGSVWRNAGLDRANSNLPESVSGCKRDTSVREPVAPVDGDDVSGQFGSRTARGSYHHAACIDRRPMAHHTSDHTGRELDRRDRVIAYLSRPDASCGYLKGSVGSTRQGEQRAEKCAVCNHVFTDMPKQTIHRMCFASRLHSRAPRVPGRIQRETLVGSMACRSLLEGEPDEK